MCKVNSSSRTLRYTHISEMFAHVTITHQQQVHNLRELPMKCLSRNHLSYSPLRLHPGMDDLSLFEMNLCQQWVYECTHICNW